MSHYDTLIIGSGEAGKFLGWSLASEGKRVGCIEEKYLGGSCPNIACLPSKNFIHSAEVVHEAAKASRDGLFTADASKVNMQAVWQRKQDMVTGLRTLHETNFKESGLELIEGHGRFVGPKIILVESPTGPDRTFTADNIVICTGSRSSIPDTPGMKEAKPLTHVELLDLTIVPPHLVILGGGYIALEFAQCMRRLGSRVTILARASRLLPREDEDIAGYLTDLLVREGIEVLTSVAVTAVEGVSGTSVILHYNEANKVNTVSPLMSNGSDETNKVLEASHILVATGRVPNTDESLGLAAANIATTTKGHIAVDSCLRSTSAPGVYAVGDCAGSPHFTHIAFDDYSVVLSQLSSSKASSSSAPRTTEGRQVPFTLFTSPELARVGLTEQEAKEKGLKYRLTKVPMLAFLRTRTMGQTEGFAKALVDERGKVIGYAALGPSMGETLPVVQLAMQENIGYEKIRDLIITHPTINEGLGRLFAAVSEA